MRPGEIALPPSPTGYTSASQVDLFTKCERAWWFRHVAKISTPSTGAQAFGTSVHGAVEAYLKGGKPKLEDFADPKIWDILELAAGHLPDPTVGGYRVEGRIELPTYAGGPIWQGFIDLWEPNKHPPEVTDHKTTSNFRYAKTPQELAENVQMVSYAKWAFSNLNTNVVRVSHLYLLTRGKPKAHYVFTDLLPEQVDRQWQRELLKVRRMISLKVVTSSDDTTPNGVDTGHCHAYGGCPYRTQCGLHPSNLITIGRTKQGDTMSTLASTLKEKLMAARAAAQGAAPAPTVSQEPQTAPTSPMPSAAIQAPTTVGNGVALGVVPPDAPPREQPASTIGTPADADATARAKAYMDGKAPEQAGPPGISLPAAPREAAHTMPQGSAEPVLAPPPPTGKKRGRPSKADVAAREAALGTAPPLGGPPRGADLAAEPAPPPTRRPSGKGTNCPACGTFARVDDAGEIMDHPGVNTDLESDEMIVCVTSGDAPADAEVWVANRRKELAALAAQRVAGAPITEAAEYAEVAADHASGANVLKSRAAPAELPEAWKPPTVAQTMERAAPVLEALAPSDGGDFHLYVNCYPVKGTHARQVTLAEDWLLPIAAAVSSEQKVADYRLVPYITKALLASGIRLARQTEGIPTVLVVNENTSGADVILECLIPFAKTVTKRC